MKLVNVSELDWFHAIVRRAREMGALYPIGARLSRLKALRFWKSLFIMEKDCPRVWLSPC